MRRFRLGNAQQAVACAEQLRTLYEKEGLGVLVYDSTSPHHQQLLQAQQQLADRNANAPQMQPAPTSSASATSSAAISMNGNSAAMSSAPAAHAQHPYSAAVSVKQGMHIGPAMPQSIAPVQLTDAPPPQPPFQQNRNSPNIYQATEKKLQKLPPNVSFF
jgi:hypothetical protein